MKARLVFFLLVFVFMSLQAEVVIAETENGTVDSKLPEITITSPAGNELFVPGEIANISFEILEDSFTAPPEEPVNLQFYFDEEQNPAYDVNMTAADTLFNYDWAVPEQSSENVYAKVTATDSFGNTAEAASGVFEITEPMIIHYGDVDDTGEVDCYDASIILMYLVDLDPIPEDPVPWEDWRIQRADVDLTGEIQAVDAAYILQYVVCLLDTLPVYEPFRSSESIISLSNDKEYLYLSSSDNLFGLDIEFTDMNNLEIQQIEILAADCLSQENVNKFALISASGINGDILRIPYQRSFAGTADISLVLESNGFSENISYTLTEHVPEANKLSAIYPNPFNPVTTINYELAESGRVKIEVYNIKGQKIVVLADENKDAGRYSLNWNAKGNNSGIYFIRYSTGAVREVKKALLLK